MLTLTEHIQIMEEVNRLMEASEQTFFTDEQIDAAEYFDLKWDPVSFKTTLSVYDADGIKLAGVDFDDADVAIAVAEELFDLDEEDLRDLDSYTWAGDVDKIEYEVLQDDGTSDE